MSVEVNERPSDAALKLMEELKSLPEEANFAQLSIQVSKKIKKQGLTNILNHYSKKFGNTDNLEPTKLSIESMTKGGSTKLFTISFSEDRSKVDFIGLAVRMTDVQDVVDYCICSYTYNEPSKSVTVEDSITRLVKGKFLWWDFDLGKLTTSTTKVVQKSVPISDRVRTCLEAAFYFELKRRGLLAIDSKSMKFELTF